VNDDENSQRSTASRLFGSYITDVAALNFRRIVEVVGVNDVAALSLFGLAVIAIIWLGAIEGEELLSIVVLFAILIFYYRMSGTKVRMAQLRNEEIMLRLAAGDNAPQLQLPTLDRPPPRPSRR
jgi:hypothetical protein